jgi:hypothetical protein
LPAKDVNDNACFLTKRGVLESFASKPAPTGIPAHVGAGLPAKVVNDNACFLTKRGALESFASKPAPTRDLRSIQYCVPPDY